MELACRRLNRCVHRVSGVELLVQSWTGAGATVRSFAEVLGLCSLSLMFA